MFIFKCFYMYVCLYGYVDNVCTRWLPAPMAAEIVFLRSWRMCRIMGIAVHSEALANQNTYSRCEVMANQNSRCHFEATPYLSLPLHHVKSTTDTHHLLRHSPLWTIGDYTMSGATSATSDQTDGLYLRTWANSRRLQIAEITPDNRKLAHF